MKSFAAGKVLRFEYDKKRIKAQPLKIVFYDGRWYLTAIYTKAERVGKDRTENYEIADIRNPRVDKEYFSDDFVLEDWNYFGLYSEGEKKEAEIHFYGKSSYKIDSTKFHPSQTTEVLSDEDNERYCRVKFRYAVKYSADLVAKVLSYGAEAEVVSPADLREEWLRKLKDAAGKYL
jgi:predicted DNA-binding transcriptional regulator YafY